VGPERAVLRRKPLLRRTRPRRCGPPGRALA
jgi:hypothetical protein